ncbi:MAG: antibiotic biosynthesis monooxygenase [Actinomycetota bacterium]|nr:antibiotic biosynthesis monooxygenase [Actinomycetota bacterium]
MMTVITTMRIPADAEEDWDLLINQRFESAHNRPGWISGQLLTPTDSQETRLIVGTWRSRDDWESWHNDPAFLEQRAKLEDLDTEQQATTWYEVVAHAHADD